MALFRWFQIVSGWFQVIPCFTKYANEDEVHKLIPQLNKRKALGPLSIPVTILKDNVSILSNPLSFIIKRLFKKCISPKSLKIAQITPVY